MFETLLSLIALVIFVILATSLPMQSFIGFVIGYLISMVVSPFVWLYLLMKRLGDGLEQDDWDIDEVVKEPINEK